VYLRLLLSVFVGVVVAIGTVRVWNSLADYNREQIARIAESESYAARSQLVRNLERVIAALESAQVFWNTYGQLPRRQWTSDADIEMAKIAGVSTILWDDPGNKVRFARTADNPVFDFRPDDLEWLDYKPLLERARQTSENTMSGPYLDESGRPYFEIYLVENESQGGGRLIALVDAEICLANLLMDESPGYAVDVIWKDVPLYSRGEAAKDIPLSWTREGMIESSLGAFWRVVHAPTQELADTLEPPSIDFILLLGLIIAVLMATLTSESWRAYSRAHAAEVAEKSLAELNRDLEHEIDLRTRELAHRNEDLQTIADSVAHDMRNPLNGIALNLQLLEEKNADLLDKSSLDILQRISPAVDQMAAILDRMLGMSRAAHSTFSREPLDMNALVKETFDELTANEPPPRVSLELADLPAVDADEMLVKMLLTNLLSNALKYTREKEKRRIQVNYEAQDGVTVYRITDNGIGFDQQSTERMFEAFKRLDSSKATAGIGLGLAIVARVVGRHGGRIWAKGIPGEQASFYFSLEPPSTGTETDSGLAQNP